MPGPVRHGSPLHGEVMDFVHHETALLDDRLHREWLGLMTEDVRYVMPVRVTSPHSLDDSAMADMAHFDEDRYSLEKRVERFEGEHAWAEDPPSRTRRFVTNVRVWHGEREDELTVVSNLLLFRSRGDIRDHDLLSARRTDVLRRTGEELRLARREVLVDESVLRTQNLAVFL